MWHAVAIAIACGTMAAAQPATRRATNIAALLAYPTFFSGRPILVVGKVGVEKDELRVSSDSGSIRLVSKGNAPDGLDEIRGEFWDIGRMKPDDPRLSTYDLRATFHFDPDGPWPKPGDVTALIASSVSATQPSQNATIRSIVLDPDRFLEQKVTITGQFSGRNLFGDLPDAPGRSRYDFVLRSTDAAIWVVNMRPKLRDTNGKEIELGLDARIDTGRWLEVRGTVQQGRGLQWVDAEAGSLKLAKPPTETPTSTEDQVRVPMFPAPEAIFSAPTEDETDVSTATTVRIQISRDIDPLSLRGHVHARYATAESAQRGEPDTPPIAVTATYNAANRVVEIKFAQPLERFRTVKIDLGADIHGTDGQPMKPFTLTFMTGGA
ncbi:MAG TPA: Ig-like domain-containing protein [Vicinamibacterales bacterium]|nr:Ig-like domain-containing protein [Vicinamibacterales bacterium]